jgi:hypothetical protein
VVNPAWVVLWHNKIFRPENLFPCRAWGSKVYCSLHKLCSWWTVRELTIYKQLCLYQMLLAMDSVLEGLNLMHQLPFEDAPLPEVYKSIFWELWGGSGRGTVQEPEEDNEGGIVEDNLVSAETHNKEGGEEKGREDILGEGCGGTTPHKNGREGKGRKDI